MAKIRPGGHGGYHPIGFEDREDTWKGFSFSCSGFAEALEQATDETIAAVNSAIVSTMNTVLRSVKAMVSREIRKKYNVPQAVLNERLGLFLGRIKVLEGVLEIGGRSVSLSYFSAKQFKGNMVKTRTKTTVKKSATKSPGVSVEVIKGRRTMLKSAWLNTFWNGHIGVLTRRGKSRYPVSVKSAISIASMFEQVEINDAIAAKIDADLERVFWHELEFYIDRGIR